MWMAMQMGDPMIHMHLEGEILHTVTVGIPATEGRHRVSTCEFVLKLRTFFFNCWAAGQGMQMEMGMRMEDAIRDGDGDFDGW